MKEFNLSLAKLESQISELKGYMDCCEPEKSPESDYKYLNQRISDLYQTFYSYVSEHAAGHIPAITSIEQLKKVIKLLGLDNEYKIEPKTIYAENGVAKELEVRFIKK